MVCKSARRVPGRSTAWPGVVSHALGELEVAVVCSQQLARDIHTAADLARYTLLDPWGVGPAHLAMLQAQAGVPQLPASRVRTFETCYEALRVAEHGLGIAFGVFPVSTPWVLERRLAVPLSQRLRTPGRVCFVHRPNDEGHFPFAALSAWLREQYTAIPALPEGRIVAS
jgi:DNA-binding transcriptional LysR family regulator